MTTLPQASTQPTINEKLEMPLDTIIQKSGNTTNNTNTNTEQKTQKKSYGKARNNYNNNNQGNFNNNNNNQNNFNSNQQNQNNQNGNSGNNQNSGNRGRRNNRVAPYEQKQRSYNNNNNNNNQGQNNNYSSSNNNNNTNNQNTSNNQNNNNTSVVSNSSSNNSTKKVVKVSSKSNVKSVAGAIAHTTRSGESPTLMATGSESVNQAVKAISIARQYLSENKLDVSVQPIYRNQEKGAVTFLLTKQSLRKKNELDDDSQQLRVARNSDPNSVAGSIANKVRAGERVVIQAIGAGSVAITVRAISLARRFLEGDAIDLCFRPEFIHVKLEEDERSAIKFTILAQQT